MRPDAIEAFKTAGSGNGRLFVSAISAWEIGMLMSRGRLPATKDALSWFNEFVAQGDVIVEAASPDILVAASSLPALAHRDPIDRIIIATARERDLRIVTRDHVILDYGALGHVMTLAC
ncbi:type II toxin-antitoxin system VapC family toxin [Rhizobium sp. DKSPLA3]|uniref:Type II toxin-antitoxin system VapC family toxin n=1 Tax=Rhizobium quercicola TaxID=2901226 RepID=A0A9X1T1M9_9HYPH|nr:type II toxin-antitoxin system VapC family toxin [Rhizobium quercicola]MCD7110727.1 type II toxin-antitoxin system VapC family toxin [Rhizobium quercicola]